MSYSARLVTKNGTTVLEEAHGLPDGIHHISGHEDEHRIDLSVTRAHLDGAQVASAAHTHTREPRHAAEHPAAAAEAGHSPHSQHAPGHRPAGEHHNPEGHHA
jgi:hypothetical protein